MAEAQEAFEHMETTCRLHIDQHPELGHLKLRGREVYQVYSEITKRELHAFLS